MHALRKTTALAIILSLAPAAPARASSPKVFAGDVRAASTSVAQHSATSRAVRLDDVGALLQPAELYGAAHTGSNGLATFYRINPSNGAAAPIGPIGFERVGAMDFDADGTLYATAELNDGTDTSVLITIDLATGAGTEVGPTGVPATGFGDTFSDISFRSSDGRLYGYIESGDGVGVIDPSTGAVTALGASGVACCGNGLAFSAAGTLYHANGNSLHTLDQTTGAATPVVGLGYPGFDDRINAMDFHPSSGALYASVRAGTGTRYLATVDVTTGTVSSIGASVAGLDAIAWRPFQAASSPPPIAPALYGAAYLGPNGLATLYRLDPATGAAAFIGPIGFERVSAMDFDAFGTLYATGERADGTDTSVLITIDVSTGRGTEVGPTGVLATGFGDGFSDISFRKDGRLYAYIEPSDGVGVINTATGAVAALGGSGAAGSGNGLAFHAAGRLLHADHDTLDEIDQTTGLATLIIPLAYPVPGERVNAMDFHPATQLLYASVNAGGTSRYLAIVDLGAGAVNQIGKTVNGLDAVAWGGVACAVVDFEGIPEGTPVGMIGGTVPVTFGPEWQALVDSDAGGGGNIANEPSPDTIAFFFPTPSGPINLGAGVRFLRFFYSATSASIPLTLTAWDATGGAGNTLDIQSRATVGTNPPAPCAGDPTGDFCLWDAVTLTSPTDNIRSLTLAGALPGQIGFDDLTYCTGPPDLLYGASYTGPNGLSTFHRIDPLTGDTIAVGSIGFERVSGMDFNENGILYAVGERNDGSNTGVLIRIDPATGAGTEVGPTGVNGFVTGDHFSDVSIMDFGRMYGYVEGGDGLALIDPTTGGATELGPTGVGCCGNGIAFLGGTLLHANDNALNRLDLGTGAATFITALGWSPPADNNPRVNAMDLHPASRRMFASVQDGSGFGTQENYLATVDLASGTVSIIGDTALGLDAIAWWTTLRPPVPPEVSPAGALIPLHATTPGPMTLDLTWEATLFTDSYRILQGNLVDLHPMMGVVPGNTKTIQCGIPSLGVSLPMPPGNVYLLVAADNTMGTGPLGFPSALFPPETGDLSCP